MAIKQGDVKDAGAPRDAPHKKPVLHVSDQPPMLLAANQPVEATREQFAVPSVWLSAQGLTEDTLRRFEVFEYNDPSRRSPDSGSVMFTIRRWSDAACVGYLGTNIKKVAAERSTYSFPRGLQKSLEVFGAVQLKERAPLRIVYVVESPFAVLKFYQQGFSAVSCFGWSASPEQIRILERLARAVCLLPNRNTYRRARVTAGEISRVLWCKMPPLPDDRNDAEVLTVPEIAALT